MVELRKKKFRSVFKKRRAIQKCIDSQTFFLEEVNDGIKARFLTYKSQWDIYVIGELKYVWGFGIHVFKLRINKLWGKLEDIENLIERKL